jgi:hypothetical protein
VRGTIVFFLIEIHTIYKKDLPLFCFRSRVWSQYEMIGQALGAIHQSAHSILSFSPSKGYTWILERMFVQ